MVREVPLHATGNPCAEHSDEGGLDDVLTVERLKACLLVGKIQEVPAMLRKKPHLKPAVFKRKVFVNLVNLIVVQHVLHRIGIDAALCALIDAPRVEDRGFVIPARRICGQNNLLLFHHHFSGTSGNNGEHRKKYAD